MLAIFACLCGNDSSDMRTLIHIHSTLLHFNYSIQTFPSTISTATVSSSSITDGIIHNKKHTCMHRKSRKEREAFRRRQHRLEDNKILIPTTQQSEVVDTNMSESEGLWRICRVQVSCDKFEYGHTANQVLHVSNFSQRLLQYRKLLTYFCYLYTILCIYKAYMYFIYICVCIGGFKIHSDLFRTKP